MPEVSMAQGTNGNGQTRAPSAADVENAALDARLDAAAKKAAIKALEGQPGTIDAPPPPPVGASGRIVIEKDGKTIILDNPTAEQLKTVGSTLQPSGDVSGWQLVALTGAVMWGIVAIVYLVLAHRRRIAGVTNVTKPSAEAEARMARIENAIESVAVEVERISEGQRFATKLLSEGVAHVANGAINVPEMHGAVPKNRGGAP